MGDEDRLYAELAWRNVVFVTLLPWRRPFLVNTETVALCEKLANAFDINPMLSVACSTCGDEVVAFLDVQAAFYFGQRVRRMRDISSEERKRILTKLEFRFWLEDMLAEQGQEGTGVKTPA